MKQEEMEMQLWEYIDGACNEADRQRISLLIASDAGWTEKFMELRALQESIAGSLELEQPSMRFAKNVMDAVDATQVAKSASQRINVGIIRGIAAFFILIIASVLGYVLATAHWNDDATTLLSRLDLSKMNFGGLFNLIICVNIVLGLVLVDIIVRRKTRLT